MLKMYELKSAKFTYKIHNGHVPTSVKEKFIAFAPVHNHNTRLQKKGSYYLPSAKT